jgi:hypothetical protein
MKTIGKFSFAVMLLAAGLGLSASSAAAQSIASGTFKLPVQAHWGMAVLPAGDYSFAVEIRGSGPMVSIRTAEGKCAGLFFSRSVTEVAESGSQSLTLTRLGDEAFVSSFHLGTIGMVLDYNVPKEASMVAGLSAPPTSSPVITAARR